MSRHKSSLQWQMCTQGKPKYIRGFSSYWKRPVLVGTIFFSCAFSSALTGFGLCPTSRRCSSKSCCNDVQGCAAQWCVASKGVYKCPGFRSVCPYFSFPVSGHCYR